VLRESSTFELVLFINKKQNIEEQKSIYQMINVDAAIIPFFMFLMLKIGINKLLAALSYIYLCLRSANIAAVFNTFFYFDHKKKRNPQDLKEQKNVSI